VDVGCVFLGRWPIPRFQGFPLVDASATGVLLPARHPLASRPSVHLAELRSLPWLGITASRWPGFREDIVEALEARGLPVEFEPPEAAGSPFVRIAAGEAWALANDRMAAVYESDSPVAYRPITDAPIPIWLAVVCLPPARAHADRLAEVARGLGLEAREPAGQSLASD
jgi:DNA-binding transcriptional LysR family regulator